MFKEDTNDYDLTGLREMLREFDENGMHASRGRWEIGKGGYDLNFEVSYEGNPIIQCMPFEDTFITMRDASRMHHPDVLVPVSRNDAKNNLDDVMAIIREEYRMMQYGIFQANVELTASQYKVRYGNEYQPCMAIDNDTAIGYPVEMFATLEEAKDALLEYSSRIERCQTSHGTVYEVEEFGVAQINWDEDHGGAIPKPAMGEVLEVKWEAVEKTASMFATEYLGYEIHAAGMNVGDMAFVHDLDESEWGLGIVTSVARLPHLSSEKEKKEYEEKKEELRASGVIGEFLVDDAFCFVQVHVHTDCIERPPFIQDKDVYKVSAEKLREYEPNVSGYAAIYGADKEIPRKNLFLMAIREFEKSGIEPCAIQAMFKDVARKVLEPGFERGGCRN